MLEDWELLAALLGGTKAMREAGDKYLPRESGESDDAYDARRNRSFLFPAVKRTLSTLTGKVFSKAISLGDDVPSNIKEWAENVDMSGRHINVFAQDVFKAALADGITYIHVDHPIQPAGITLADERQLGSRPYMRHILARDLFWWWSEIVNGKEQLTEVRIMEKVRERIDRYTDREVEQIRVLRIGEYELWRKGEDDNWAPYEIGEVSVKDEIPIRAIYTGRKGFMIAEPPLIDLAWMNVCHWQSSSDQRNILRIARVPFLFGAGIPAGALADPKTGKVTLGAQRAVTIDDPGATLGYVEHTGSAIAAGRTDLQDLKDEMAAMGFEMLIRKPGGETATSKAIDSAEINCVLAAMAVELQDGLEAALAFMAKWTGESTGGGSVVVNHDFGFSVEDAAIGKVLLDARAAKELSRGTLWKEWQRRGILAEDFDAEAEQALLDAEPPDTLLQDTGAPSTEGGDVVTP